MTGLLFRKMRRPLMTLMLVSALARLPAQNNQKVYPVDSGVYEAIRLLYLSRGLALPSTSGPWSGDELLLMLRRIDAARLTPGERAAFDYAEALLALRRGTLHFSGALNLEAYGHTNTAVFTRPEDYIRPLGENRPFINLDAEVWITPHAYGFFELPLANTIYNTMVTKDGKSAPGSTLFGARPFGINAIMIPPAGGEDFSLNFPVRGFVAAGGRGFSFQIGRDRLSWGPGESGNFMAGDHVPYHSMFRTAFYGEAVKWSFNVSSFSFPGDFYGDDGAGNAVLRGWGSQYDEVEGLNLFIAHRFEARGFNGRAGFAFTEGLMYQSAGALDPVVLLPAMFLHNLYRMQNANSMITFEADYAVFPALNVYVQLAMDEFSMGFGEAVPGRDDDARPNGFGYMAGLRGALPLGAGMIAGSAELVFTDPYLYLRLKNSEQGSGPRLDWVVANRYHYSATEGAYYVEDFLGYRWGGDAVVLNLNVRYRTFARWNAAANVMLLFHGAHDKWTAWTLVDNGDGQDGDHPPNSGTPSSAHPGRNFADRNAGERDAVNMISALTLSGEYLLLENLRAYGRVDLVRMSHPG
ncbi:MAG: hypothetical protein LBQ35_01915, partial [Spirochaetaceae bacterium]|nr:hypothetical protein [Spirochaetaceae bacterium]